MTRRICVVTGSRAEYGLLRWIMQGIKSEPSLTLQLIVTGMHLSPEFGLTYKEIEQDGFCIDRKIEMLTSSDTSTGIAKSMGLGLIGFADAVTELNPDLLLLLGDRFEIFAAASTALVSRIPVAHIHGGEITEGAFDDALRHSVTKMAHLHFVANETYRLRVVQLGEQPNRVFTVGGLGVDGISRVPLLSKSELEARLDFRFGARNLLITFHPVTLGLETAPNQMKELLAALADLTDTHLIFTLPNADPSGRELIAMVEDFVRQKPNAKAFTSLGQTNYLSCVTQVDGVIGNSSSGLLEVPTLKKPTINIGDRQAGRLQAESVVNCDPTREDIGLAIRRIYSAEFTESLRNVNNPYGDSGASTKVIDVLKRVDLTNILKKTFYDLASISSTCEGK